MSKSFGISVNHSDFRPIIQSLSKSFTHSGSPSLILWITQWLIQSFCQSFGRSVNHSVVQNVSQSFGRSFKWPGSNSVSQSRYLNPFYEHRAVWATKPSAQEYAVLSFKSMNRGSVGSPRPPANKSSRLKERGGLPVQK